MSTDKAAAIEARRAQRRADARAQRVAERQAQRHGGAPAATGASPKPAAATDDARAAQVSKQVSESKQVPESEQMSANTSVLFVTVHKGASTFIANEFAVAYSEVFPEARIVNLGNEVIAGTPHAELPVNPTGDAFIRLYPRDIEKMKAVEPGAQQPFDNVQLVFLQRDPRDAAISLYHSKARSHGTNVRNPEKLLEERAELQEMTLYEGVLAKTARQTMREFLVLRELAEIYPHALMTTYEELVTNYAGWLDRVADHLGWSQDEKLGFYQRTSDSFKPPSTEDPSQHKRRITPGNWTEIDTPELRALYERLGADALAAAGYGW